MSTESTTEYNRLASEGSADQSSTKDVAKEQAAGVASSAGQAGQHVAGVAKDQAGNVAAEASRQARDVVGQARTELSQQAVQQQQRVADGLHSIGSELGSMADRSEEPGLATDLARQAGTKAHELAYWLEKREPSGLLDEVKTFARQRPGAFLAIALGAGLAAGRLTRGLKDDSASTSPSPRRDAPGADSDAMDPSYDMGGRSTATTGAETVPGYPPPTPAVPVVEPVAAPEQTTEQPYGQQPFVETPYTERPYTERPDMARPYTESSTPTGHPESRESRP